MTIKVNRLNITDCVASPASTFIAINSTDGGNNVNWTFATGITGSATASATASLVTSYNPQIWSDESFDSNTWTEPTVISNTWTDVNFNNNSWNRIG